MLGYVAKIGHHMNREVDSFLQAYPSVAMIEALITDCNGVARGKLIPRSKIHAVLKDGLKLPKSALGLDIWGRDIPALAHANGDIDGYCLAVEESLKPTMTKRGIDQGQLIMTMVNEDGSPYLGDPRQILSRLVSEFRRRGLTPCMAVELEFSLLPDPGHDRPLREALKEHDTLGGNLYALDELDRHGDMLDELREAFKIQDLPYEGIIKESAPAQFEINMAHSDDVLTLADQIIRMQRGIRTVATRHGLIASFMPKPMDNEAGNGMHVHCSLLQKDGSNVFNNDSEQGSPTLGNAIAGCLALMPESMLIFAPGFNAYRRFQAGNHAPTVPTWGYDNRTTALRVPAGPPMAKRIEHRVAGADANPYLVLAVVLAGILHGVDTELSPPNPIDGNAWDMEHGVDDLPCLMEVAISRFEESTLLAQYLSADFQTLFAYTKRQELSEFQRRVTDFEIESYLRG
jgi:glutamine synthetase